MLISLVTEEDGEAIGHILFSSVTIGGANGITGLAPMAVLPNWQRKSVGTQLVYEGLKACKKPVIRRRLCLVTRIIIRALVLRHL